MLRVAFLVNSFSDLEREVTLLQSLLGFWAFQNGPPPWEGKDQCEGEERTPAGDSRTAAFRHITEGTAPKPT